MTATSHLGSHRNRQRCRHYCQPPVVIERRLQHIWPNGAYDVLTFCGSKVGTNRKSRTQPSGIWTTTPLASSQWYLLVVARERAEHLTSAHPLCRKQFKMMLALPPSSNEPAVPECQHSKPAVGHGDAGVICDDETTERRKVETRDEQNGNYR